MNRRRALGMGAALASVGWQMGIGAAADAASSDPLAASGSLQTPIGLPYFGTNLHRLLPDHGQREAPTRWPAGLIGALRLWDCGTGWADIAPRPGEWSWDRFDGYVDAARTNDATVLYTLGITPRWASARPDEPGPYGPGSAAEPVKMAHWTDYLRHVVGRYRGRIAAYELWNEPLFTDDPADHGRPGFFTGRVAHMVEMAQIARRVLDELDPTAILSTPGFVNGPWRLDSFLANGGAACVQAIAYHFYSRDSAQFAEQVAAVRAVVLRHGLQQLPLWNTECGVETTTDDPPSTNNTVRLTEADAALKLSQFLLLGAGLHIDRFHYYAWDSERSGMVDRLGAWRPRYTALRDTEAWLLGNVVHGARSHGTGFVVQAQTEGVPCAYAWSDVPSTIALPVPPGWRVATRQTLSGPVVTCTSDRVVALAPAPTRFGFGRSPSTITTGHSGG